MIRRDPEDDEEARTALNQWLIDQPEAAIIVAAINRGTGDELDISLHLSCMTPYQLVGLIQALLAQAIEAASRQSGGANRSPELDALREVQAFLEGGPAMVPTISHA
jgi:hypothetical protein